MRITIISLILTVFCFNSIGQEYYQTIHYHAQQGNLRELKVLVLQGVDINARGTAEYGDEKTPLMMAVRGNEIEIVKWLVENGADITIKNVDDLTAIDIAIEQLGEDHPITAYLRDAATVKVKPESSVDDKPIDAAPIWPWLLAFAMIGGQIWYATSGEAFQWPNMFRWLGTLSFAGFALMIAVMLTYEKATSELASWEIFEILLTPFVGFISCFLTAHVLETFNEIKKNTDKLREAD